MSINSVATFVVVLSILAIVYGAPRRLRRSLTPTWHLPCGEILEAEVPTSDKLDEEIRASLESIKLQHQLTMNDYLNRDYDYLYESVRIGVHEHQYIPNWVPGKKDVNSVKNLVQKSEQTVINH